MILLDNRTPLDVTTFDAKDLEEKPFQTVVVKGMFCIERDKPVVPRPMMRKLKQSCAAFADLTPQPPLQLRGYAARGEGGAVKSLFSGSLLSNSALLRNAAWRVPTRLRLTHQR